jgi:glycosyltransferase involved in cell wall biosynthesis
MRVLQLISSHGVYGAENMVLSLCAALERLGCQTTLGIFQNAHAVNRDFIDEAARRRLDFVSIPCRGRIDRETVIAIRRTADARHTQVLHTHGYKADIYGYVAMARASIPLVSTCHNWTNRTRSVTFYGLLDRVVLRRYQGVIAVSSGVAESLRRFGVSEQRTHIINNGVDVCRFQAIQTSSTNRETTNGRCRGTRIGFVGRLSKEKGPEFFVRAAQALRTRLPEAEFILYGNGPEEEMLQVLVSDLGLRRTVQFKGHINDPSSIYSSLDIVVLPSLQEGLPMTLLEALASGKAVVATKVGEVPSVIHDSTMGILVQPGDLSSLGDAIATLAENPELRYRLGAKGRLRVAESYSADAMGRRYLDIYEGVSDHWAAQCR